MKSNLGSEIFYTFWAQRDLRERRMLLLAAFFVGLSIIYLVFINPALTGREKLQKSIPQLRQQVAEMELLSQQFAQISGSLSENVAPVVKEDLEKSLSTRSIKPLSLIVSDDVVRLQLKQVDYSGLMDWLLEQQKITRITVEDAKITALNDNGQVDATLTLKQQRR